MFHSGTIIAYSIVQIKTDKPMLRIIIVFALSLYLWNKWGGFSNDIATLIILLADAFICTIIASNRKQATETETDK